MGISSGRCTPGGPLRGAPTIANGQVYVMSQDNQIYALKRATARPTGSRRPRSRSPGVFGVASPAVGQGTVVAGFSSGELNAYRYENGRALWQDTLERTSISTWVSSLNDIDADPVIDNGQVFAVGQGGRMVALDITTGQRLWELNIAGIATPGVAGDWIFVVTDRPSCCASPGRTATSAGSPQLPRLRTRSKKNADRLFRPGARRRPADPHQLDGRDRRYVRRPTASLLR